MDYRATIQQIFLAGIERVLPSRLINSNLIIKDNKLIINDLRLKLDEIENIYVVGAGKASGCMAAEVENLLGERVTEGHIVVKYDHTCSLKYIEVAEAGHPLPDLNGVKATLKILEIVHKAGISDLLICLISGGGSALLADYPDHANLEETIHINELLIRSGASIQEINTVRKHLSLVKGGQLAKAAFPATVVTFILSDVVGDQVDAIASGPTTADPTTFNDALDILSKYNLTHVAPKSVLQYLTEGKNGIRKETPKPDDPVFKRTFNYIIGNNRLALEAASKKAEDYDIRPLIITDNLQGYSSDVADYIIDEALKTKQTRADARPTCLLFGGETTIKVKGTGTGGRNQHLALLCAKKIAYHKGITVLAAGTDGTDGPTDAAGAIVDSNTIKEAALKGLDVDKFLTRFDSYHFFKRADGHLFTGPTLTNVMDMVVVIVE